MNELLEEAIARAFDVAWEAASHLLERAQALGTKVEAEAEEAHGLFQARSTWLPSS